MVLQRGRRGLGFGGRGFGGRRLRRLHLHQLFDRDLHGAGQLRIAAQLLRRGFRLGRFLRRGRGLFLLRRGPGRFFGAFFGCLRFGGLFFSRLFFSRLLFGRLFPAGRFGGRFFGLVRRFSGRRVLRGRRFLRLRFRRFGRFRRRGALRVRFRVRPGFGRRGVRRGGAPVFLLLVFGRLGSCRRSAPGRGRRFAAAALFLLEVSRFPARLRRLFRLLLGCVFVQRPFRRVLFDLVLQCHKRYLSPLSGHGPVRYLFSWNCRPLAPLMAGAGSTDLLPMRSS